MKIPTWDETAAIPVKERNPLEHFIYEHEPIGIWQEDFREGLAMLIAWVKEATDD